MRGISKCECCLVDFEWIRFSTQNKARFCSKACWYNFNAKKLASYNDTRFQWKTASEEEKQKKLIENYEKYVIRKQGCWEWSGVKDKDGYGQIPSGYHKHSKAHRVSWAIHKSVIPKKTLVCHHCDNPECTNPEHLFLGTQKQNNEDCIKKGRAAVGSKQPKSKLNEFSVVEIRRLLALGVKSRKIAKDFNVSPSIICEINKGRSWKHV